MSFLTAAPEFLTGAAADLQNIETAIGQANAAAAWQTITVPAAGADEVSAGVAALFGGHAQAYQAASAQAASIHQRFVQALTPARRPMRPPRRPAPHPCRRSRTMF